MSDHDQLVAAVRAGDTRAVARACRVVDEGWPGHQQLLEALYPAARGSWFIGITGSPGVGKSSLTSALTHELRRQGKRIAIVAVDPSSPFSGGAILGDRIRMQAHFSDPDVFIRSLGTRGAMGGLSRTAADVARVLAAWGAAVVLIETVGVGQDELDVMRVAHSTVVVQAPGGGDDVQAAKAGLLECADIFAVNKADLPAAAAVVQQLRSMLAIAHVTAAAALRSGHAAAAPLRSGHAAAGAHGVRPGGTAAAADAGWEVPVVPCVATRGEGVRGLLDELERHRAWLMTPPGRARSAERLRQELARLVRDGVAALILERHEEEINRAVESLAADETDPYSASRALILRWAESPSS